MSQYLQSLTAYLHEKELLTDSLKKSLEEHDKIYSRRPSLKMPFGKFKGELISNIVNMEKGRSYLDWVRKQEYVKEKFTNLKEEIDKIL